MTTLPVTPMTLPTSLTNQPNGNIDPSLMVPVHARGSLHTLAHRAWTALVAEAGKRGLPLTFTYGGMYRTYQEQYDLFVARYTTAVVAGTSRKFWNGRWWYLKPGMAMAAVPGTSNHGLGLAIDAAFDRDVADGLGPEDATGITSHPQWPWFRDNVSRFGFSFEVQSEPWHIRYVAGDNVPQAVLDYEASLAPLLPPFRPGQGEFGLWPVAKKRAAKRGDQGDRVAYLQGVLKKDGYKVGGVDGKFGPTTEEAVVVFQTKHGLTPDGWVGPKTWAVIDRRAMA